MASGLGGSCSPAVLVPGCLPMPARVPSSPSPSPSAIGKSDRALRDVLERSPRDVTVRVVMTLGEPEGRRRAGPSAPRIAGPRAAAATPRLADRRALIDSRKRDFEEAYGGVRRSLEGLGLKVAGGGVTRGLVVEGRTADIARGLELPQVQRASLDREWTRPAARRAVRPAKRVAAAKPRVRSAGAAGPASRPAARQAARR